MKRALLDRLNADRAAKRPVALVTRLEGGAQTLVYGDGSDGEGLPAAAVDAARRALVDDKSAPVEIDDTTYFVHVHNPPLRLFVVGAVHITQALAEIATVAGYAVTVIDPRRAFADAARFPALTVSTEWPDDAFERLTPDYRSAVVTLSHDPKIDDPALSFAMRSPVFYIGALGSKRTHQRRLDRLREAGFSDAELGLIHSPVGLPIGAGSPAEIAIAIMAEVTQARRRPAGKPPRDKPA